MLSPMYSFPILLGIFTVVAIFGVFKAHKLPKFNTEAFKAKPPDAQRRAIRNLRIVYAVCAVVLMTGFSVVGFITLDNVL